MIWQCKKWLLLLLNYCWLLHHRCFSSSFRCLFVACYWYLCVIYHYNYEWWMGYCKKGTLHSTHCFVYVIIMTTDCTYDIKHDVFFSQYTFTLTQQAKNRTDVHTSHINPSINSIKWMIQSKKSNITMTIIKKKS